MATETITSITEPWAAQQPYLRDLFSRANTLYGQGPLQAYGGDWVADFGPDTLTGMDSLRTAAMNPQYQNQALGAWGGMLGQSGSGLPSFVNPTFQNLSQYGAGAGAPNASTFNFLQNPGMYGANPMAMASLAGFQQSALPGAVQNALGGLSNFNFGGNASAMAAMQGLQGYNYGGNSGDLGLRGLQNFSYGGDPGARTALQGFQGMGLDANVYNPLQSATQASAPGASTSTLTNLAQSGAGGVDPTAQSTLSNLTGAQFGPSANVSNALSGFMGGGQNPLSWQDQRFQSLANQSGNAMPSWAVQGMQSAATGQNPYLDAMYDQAASRVAENYREAVAPSIQGQFAAAGRYGDNASLSNALQNSRQELGDTLNNLATNLYGGQYQSDRNRSLQASTQAGQLFSDNAFRNSANQLAATQASGQLASSNFQNAANRGLQAAQALGGLQGQGQALGAQTQLGAAQSLGGLGQDANALNAQTRMGGATSLADVLNRVQQSQISAAGQLGQLGQGLSGQQLQAAGALGDLGQSAANLTANTRLGASGQLSNAGLGAAQLSAGTQLGAAGSLADTSQAAQNLSANTRLGAAGQYGNLFNNLMSNQIGAAGQMGGLYQDANQLRANSMLGAATNYGDLFNQAAGMNANARLGAAQNAGMLGVQNYGQNLDAQRAALGMTDQMTQLPFLGGNALMNLGSYDQQQRQAEIGALMDKHNFQQQAPWDLLSRFGSTVQGNYGGVGSQTAPLYSNPGWADALGWGMAGNAILGNPFDEWWKK